MVRFMDGPRVRLDLDLWLSIGHRLRHRVKLRLWLELDILSRH